MNNCFLLISLCVLLAGASKNPVREIQKIGNCMLSKYTNCVFHYATPEDKPAIN